jgi:hypothetical protein
MVDRAHNAKIHSTGVKLIHHPIVGDLDPGMISAFRRTR